MSDSRILQFDDPTHHHSVQQLLPWYVNGTLDAAEAERVSKHLDGCALCRIDLASQQALKTQMQADPWWAEGMPSAEAGLAELRGRLQKTPPVVKPAPGLPDHVAVGRRTVLLTRIALAAQFAAIVVLSSVLLHGADPIGRDVLPSPHGTYVTRSAAWPDHAGDRLIADFRAEASEASVRALLMEIDARIVDGPTVTGAYVIDVPGGRGATALQTLRARVATVRTAEGLSLGQAH